MFTVVLRAKRNHSSPSILSYSAQKHPGTKTISLSSKIVYGI